MKLHWSPPSRLSGRFLSVIAFLSLTTVMLAQVAPPLQPAYEKYDADKSHRANPGEGSLIRADKAKTASLPTETSGEDGEVLQLSPFEVKESNSGYLATNTMSGTRLNTKLEDLGSSISVVTKQQMTDFAMLDINDIFAYEGATEGTGNYTNYSVDRNGMVGDSIQGNPQGSNRIRGIGVANISVNGFATSGRVPIDPIDVDSVEISRGPNSSIFGLGDAAGTVNLVSSTATLGREYSRTQFRVDDRGGMADFARPESHPNKGQASGSCECGLPARRFLTKALRF